MLRTAIMVFLYRRTRKAKTILTYEGKYWHKDRSCIEIQRRTEEMALSPLVLSHGFLPVDLNAESSWTRFQFLLEPYLCGFQRHIPLCPTCAPYSYIYFQLLFLLSRHEGLGTHVGHTYTIHSRCLFAGLSGTYFSVQLRTRSENSARFLSSGKIA